MFASNGAAGSSAEETIRSLWGKQGGFVDPDEIAAACSEDVVWEDMRLKASVFGREAVASLLREQIPKGTMIMLDRVADGVQSSGFTWTRGCAGSSNEEIKFGLRGTTFVRLNEAGLIECVKELSEPLFKPGDMMLKLLQAATKNVARPEKNPTFTSATPTSCTDIVNYIWNEAYPKDAPVDEAMRFYSDAIVYQDFNYQDPIVGIKDVESFSREWGDFPGIQFRIQDLSEGDISCCFTWRVTVNGKEGPQGISFYETDGHGKIIYIRDTPSPTIKPTPLGTLAKLLRPRLRVFRSRKDLVGGLPKDIAAFE